ncbi:MAG: class I SAM-dependent RNA methyltransferase [Propionicimonas sp.]
MAHGGHWVVRVPTGPVHTVVFARHTLEGELVRLRITEVRPRFCRGEVIEVVEASPLRRPAPCPIAARCGGCDFQHVGPAHSRELKRQVVTELLQHSAGVNFSGEVEAVQPDEFGWRTRMRFLTDAQGLVGLRAHRSNDLVPLPAEGCRIANPAISRPRPTGVTGGVEVVAAAASSGSITGPADELPDSVTEHVGERDFDVSPAGFWQSHTAAPDTLTHAVRQALAPRSGEAAFDLFCGVGLFAATLLDAGCRVWGIEGDARAVAFARRNVPGARFSVGDVARALRRLPARTDLVVLDPPRSGAGAQVMRAIASRRPRAIAYVACDPASLARDLSTAAAFGYATTSVRAFDLFPMTHHVECLALLEPDGAARVVQIPPLEGEDGSPPAASVKP